jgi:hypothetical protein
MSQFGGLSKRHFTVVMDDKEHGLYVSSTPSSAAKKAVTKLCASNKSKKVEFCLREITQGSKKKTYGPYLGHIEKLKKPIELKGRVIKYKPVVKLSKKKSEMKGGGLKLDDFEVINQNSKYKYIKNIFSPDQLFFGKKKDYRGKKYYSFVLFSNGEYNFLNSFAGDNHTSILDYNPNYFYQNFFTDIYINLDDGDIPDKDAKYDSDKFNEILELLTIFSQEYKFPLENEIFLKNIEEVEGDIVLTFIFREKEYKRKISEIIKKDCYILFYRSSIGNLFMLNKNLEFRKFVSDILKPDTELDKKIKIYIAPNGSIQDLLSLPPNFFTPEELQKINRLKISEKAYNEFLRKF